MHNGANRGLKAVLHILNKFGRGRSVEHIYVLKFGAGKKKGWGMCNRCNTQFGAIVYSYACLCSSFSCSLSLCSHRSLKLYGQTDVFSKSFGEKSCIIIHLKKFHFLHGFLHFCYYCYWLWLQLHISTSFLNQYLLQCF